MPSTHIVNNQQKAAGLEMKCYEIALEYFRQTSQRLSDTSASIVSAASTRNIAAAVDADNNNDDTITQAMADKKLNEEEQHNLKLLDNRQNEIQLDIADTLTCMVYVYDTKLNKPKQALEHCYLEFLRIYKIQLGNLDNSVGSTLHNMGAIHCFWNQAQDALECLIESLSIDRDYSMNKEISTDETTVLCYELLAGLLPRDSLELADILFKLGACYAKKGMFNDALAMLQNVLRLQLSHESADNELSIANTYHNLGGVYFEKQNYKMALRMYEEDLQITQRKLGDQEEVAETLSSIGHIYRKLQDYEKARDRYEECLRMRHVTLNDDDLRVVSTLSNLAFVAKMNKASTKKHSRCITTNLARRVHGPAYALYNETSEAPFFTIMPKHTNVKLKIYYPPRAKLFVTLLEHDYNHYKIRFLKWYFECEHNPKTCHK